MLVLEITVCFLTIAMLGLDCLRPEVLPPCEFSHLERCRLHPAGRYLRIPATILGCAACIALMVCSARRLAETEIVTCSVLVILIVHQVRNLGCLFRGREP